MSRFGFLNMTLKRKVTFLKFVITELYCHVNTCGWSYLLTYTMQINNTLFTGETDYKCDQLNIFLCSLISRVHLKSEEVFNSVFAQWMKSCEHSLFIITPNWIWRFLKLLFHFTQYFWNNFLFRNKQNSIHLFGCVCTVAVSL